MTSNEEQIAAVQKRYRVCAGRILIARDQVAVAASGEYVASKVVDVDGKEREILGTQARGEINQMFEPWGEVLMIGERYQPDDYRPELRIGQRVYFSATGARDVELAVGEEKMTITIVPFEGIVMIDDGETVKESEA